MLRMLILGAVLLALLVPTGQAFARPGGGHGGGHAFGASGGVSAAALGAPIGASSRFSSTFPRGNAWGLRRRLGPMMLRVKAAEAA